MVTGQGGQSIFEFQAYGLEEAVTSLEEYGKRLAIQGKVTKTQYEEVNKLTSKYRQSAEGLQRLSDAYGRTKDLDKLKKISDEFQKQAKQVDVLDKKIKNVYKEAKAPIKLDMDSDFGGGGYGGGLGSVASSVSSTLGRSGGMNDNVISQFLQGIDALVAMGNEAQTLHRDIKEAIPQIQSFATTAISGAKDMRLTMSGVGSALTSVAGIAGIATVAFMALGKIFEVFQSELDKTSEATRRYIEAVREETERRYEINSLVNEGAFDSVQSQFDSLATRYRVLNDLLDTHNRGIEEMDRAYTSLGANFSPGERSRIAQRGKDLRDARDAIVDELGQVMTAMGAYESALPDAQVIRQRLDAIERVQDAENDLVQVRLEAQSAYQSYLRQIEDEEEQHQWDMRRQTEDRQIEDKEAYASHLTDLAKITKSYQDDVIRATLEHQGSITKAQQSAYDDLKRMQEEVNKDLADMATQLSKDILETQNDYTTKFHETNQQYFESTRENLERHLKGMAEAQDAYDKERRRRLEDLNDELLQAEQSNDVLAFLSAQKNAEKDLERMAEDFGERRDETQRQFDEESQQRRIEHEQTLVQMRIDTDERIAELKASHQQQREERLIQYREQVVERRQALRDELEEMRNAHKERLIEMRNAHDEERKASKAQYEEQEKERQRRRDFDDRRAQEDRQRQLDQMAKAHNEQLALMQTQEDEYLRIIQSGGTYQKQAVTSGQLAIVSAYTVGAQQAVSAINSAMQRVGSTTTTATDAGNTQANASSLAQRIREWATRGNTANRPQVAFAQGGVVTSPTIAMLGEGLGGRYDAEAVIPFNRSEGIDMALRNNGVATSPIVIHVSPHFSTSVGDIATGSQVSQALEQYNMQLTQTITTAIRQARLAQ